MKSAIVECALLLMIVAVRILSAQPRSREGVSGHCAIRIRFRCVTAPSQRQTRPVKVAFRQIPPTPRSASRHLCALRFSPGRRRRLLRCELAKQVWNLQCRFDYPSAPEWYGLFEL
jgi:hypothetical protein